jgi:hypothetical protein
MTSSHVVSSPAPRFSKFARRLCSLAGTFIIIFATYSMSLSTNSHGFESTVSSLGPELSFSPKRSIPTFPHLAGDLPASPPEWDPSTPAGADNWECIISLYDQHRVMSLIFANHECFQSIKHSSNIAAPSFNCNPLMKIRISAQNYYPSFETRATVIIILELQLYHSSMVLVSKPCTLTSLWFDGQEMDPVSSCRSLCNDAIEADATTLPGEWLLRIRLAPALCRDRIVPCYPARGARPGSLGDCPKGAARG